MMANKQIESQPSKLNAVIFLILRLLLAAAAIGTYYYFVLPPLNPMSEQFWIFLLFAAVCFALAVRALNFSAHRQFFQNFDLIDVVSANAKQRSKMLKFPSWKKIFNGRVFSVIAYILIGVPIVVLVFGTVFSSVVLNATAYSEVITVEERDFNADMPETKEITNIALMDTNSARMLGDRKLGALSSVVSQYVVSDDYTQINYKGKPIKITHLEYDGFFKWIGNRSNGIPGYIMVDTLGNTAEYYESSSGIRYAQSGYFEDDLMRKLRFDYPTKIFDLQDVSFEVDEQGNPYYCISCYTPRVGLFGAYDVEELIIFNPLDGTSTLYAVEDVPQWVDVVFDGDLACQKYDWQGIYSGGFINSIIGNKGCKRTTDDFGYLMFDDDVWYFTGVTSVTSDASNIGFILSNARTGEYRFYPVIGAEEHSAMHAAEGEVQEKEYVASFPSLVNISGVPTYIMVLKDNNGLVKLYALVNVRQYTMVATGETQQDAVAAYLKMLSGAGVNTEDPAETEQGSVTVADVKFLTLDGSTYAYVTAQDGNVYRVAFTEENEQIVLVRPGDVLEMTWQKGDIRIVRAWKRAE